jgi:hydroxymethylpyrimidine pyrophosphatase-like HAD family hydrolase
MVIGVDFDGTIVREAYPDIGEPLPGALETLRWLNSRGVKIILYTMRDHKEDRDTLQEALDYLKENGVMLWAVNYNPDQEKWSNSRKVFCDHYLDDRNIGTPLDSNGSVDWVRMKVLLEKLIGGDK